MQKTCKITGLPFEISSREEEFCRRFDIPLPEISPLERMRKLMATRNEWKLYPRKCDATGDHILSAYPEDSPFKVYKNEFWWGDQWEALDYGRDFDFNKPFFEQFRDLQLATPREGTTIFNSENCDYNSHTRESKNCYLNSLMYRGEDIYYSYWIVNDKDIYDSMYTYDSTLCSWCSDVKNGYQCIMLEEGNDCNECCFSCQLRGCDHCIFCNNLANKSYYIFNKKVSKEDFEDLKKKLLDGSWQTWQKSTKQYKEIRQRAKNRFVHNLQCENVTGDHVYNSRNCENCFESFDSEDCFNSISLAGSKDVQNAYSAGWTGCEVCVHCAVIRACQHCAFCTYTWYSSGMLYCDSCVSCENCFGCIGLRHKKNCIFNKQYSEKEYNELLSKIIAHMKESGEWGQFFPPKLSHFPYNETAAQNFYSLTREEAEKKGFRWREKDQKEYQPATILGIPDNIADISDEILKETLACEDCGKNYRLIIQELKFYRRTGLPVPRHCPECRHKMRFNTHNPCVLVERECKECGKEVESTYEKEDVYCEGCYLETID
ncbi:MAG: hypothetical protein ABII07_00555 [Patescibacteria group bacterium]|nr:hypothetical protein [Patescibacteria group bacterium]